MKTVSILVPMYGAERYIEQCAHSLFSQSYSNCEFIFVDDASRDKTLERLRSTVAQYPQLNSQIKIVECAKNGGVAAARNLALDTATGDYILFVDADDWVNERIVEMLVLRTIETQADICNAWCMSVNADDGRYPTPVSWVGSNTSHLKAVLEQSHIVPNHVRGMLFSRALFEDHSLRFVPQVDFGEDYSLLPQIIYYAKELSTLREYLYYYRTYNDASYMNNIGDRHIANYVDAAAIVAKFIESLPDAPRFRRSLVLGRLNIKKWIFKRGVVANSYNNALFGTEKPAIHYPMLWLYNRVIDGGSSILIKIFGVIVNLPLYIKVLFYR
ncbi:MAG: glycosyltransferase family 2 protein [Rikenellaceae bacterium]